MILTQNVFSPFGFYLDYFAWCDLHLHSIVNQNIFILASTISRGNKQSKVSGVRLQMIALFAGLSE